MLLLNSNARFLAIVFVHIVFAEMDNENTRQKANQLFVRLLKNIINVNEKRLAALKRVDHLQNFMMAKESLSKIHEYDIKEEDDSREADSSEYGGEQHAILTVIDKKSNLNVTFRRKYYKKQEAPNNNINIIIPFNSFNIKSQYKNQVNSNMNRRNDDDNEISNGNYNKRIGTIVDKFMTIHELEKRNIKSGTTDYENDYSTEMRYQYDGNDNLFDSNKMDAENENDDQNTNYRRKWSGSCDRKAAKVCRRACVDAHKNGCMLYKCSRRAKKAFRKECKRSCKSKFITGKYSDSEWESE